MSEEVDGPIPIGEKYGKTFLITVKPPQKKYWESNQDFEEKAGEIMITVHYRDQNGKKEEIARIDNSHGEMHLHRFYSEQENTEKIDMNFQEALDYIYSNWEHLADIKENNTD